MSPLSCAEVCCINDRLEQENQSLKDLLSDLTEQNTRLHDDLTHSMELLVSDFSGNIRSVVLDVRQDSSSFAIFHTSFNAPILFDLRHNQPVKFSLVVGHSWKQRARPRQTSVAAHICSYASDLSPHQDPLSAHIPSYLLRTWHECIDLDDYLTYYKDESIDSSEDTHFTEPRIMLEVIDFSPRLLEQHVAWKEEESETTQPTIVRYLHATSLDSKWFARFSVDVELQCLRFISVCQMKGSSTSHYLTSNDESLFCDQEV